MLVDIGTAQAAFLAMPPDQQLITLSPAYCLADAQRDPGIKPRFLLGSSGEATVLHSVHESCIPGGGADWQSPYGYGGPVCNDAELPARARVWRAFDDLAHQQNIVAEFVRFHPIAANHTTYPGLITEDRVVASIDLGKPDLVSTYIVRARNTLRKALKLGLVACWVNPLEHAGTFATVYNQAMMRLNASAFYMFESGYFEAICALPASRLLLIRQADEVVAAGIFLFGPQTAEYHLSASTSAGRITGATNLLLHEAAMRAQAEGLKTLFLGGGTNSSPGNSLLHFKQGFGRVEGRFRFGSRILNPAAYRDLQARFPEASRNSSRVLFYRSG